ncbi:transglycosylase domain-containing protein [Pueribacillus sp. YX66]|uniref:transglycosylase domain-containing protein n=1 Tax=Pueribacillus sp. YX66 TaxID=3229242 RepID=UPI00358D97B1
MKEKSDRTMFKKTVSFSIIFSLFILFVFSFIGVTKEVKQTKTPKQWWKDEILLHNFHIENNSQFLDKNGEVFEEVYLTERRKYIEYEDIPIDVIHAFVAVEDQSFFTHRGVDIRGIGRALLTNAEHASIEEGGSTITQQLARNLFLTNEKKYERKLKELLISFKLEKQYTKEEIIEYYINKIYFQNGVYGIEAASHYYFGKQSNELSLAEIAFLVAIPNNPTLYNPIKNIEKTKERQKHVLKNMLANNYISKNEHDKAIAEKVNIQIQKPIHQYPDYTDYVYREFKALVAEKEGFKKQLQKAETDEEKQKIQEKLQERTNEWLYVRGVHVHTALDPKLQVNAVHTVQHVLSNLDVEGAVVIINHNAHTIQAVVAGKDFKRQTLNYAYQIYRQPGSAIKPLLVFAPYIEKTGASTSQLIDASRFCKGSFCPKNYGNANYHRVTVEKAFISSINTAAVRLMNNTGVEESFNYLKPFQFEKALKSDKNLASAIGGFTYGVSPAELTKAYTTFATNGTFTQSYAIQKVTDANGETLFQWEKKTTPVWSKTTNDKMRKLLNKTITSGTARRAYVSKNYIGGKTGTTNDVKDLWFIGLTDDYTAGVWIGNQNGKSISRYESARPHLQIWKEIMQVN